MLREALSCMHTAIDRHQAAGQSSLRLLARLVKPSHPPDYMLSVGIIIIMSSAAQQKSSCLQGAAHMTREPCGEPDASRLALSSLVPTQSREVAVSRRVRAF